MSRCRVCDVILSEDELRNKDYNTGAYLDTCYQCLDNLASDLEVFTTESDDTRSEF